MSVSLPAFSLIGARETFDAAVEDLVDLLRQYCAQYVEFYRQTDWRVLLPLVFLFALTPTAQQRDLLRKSPETRAAEPVERRLSCWAGSCRVRRVTGCWARGGTRASAWSGVLGAGSWGLRPRRARCRACAVTHVLLADLCLLRRRNEVSVIGVAIEAKVTSGAGHRTIAGRLGVHKDTVRGWLRRFAARAEQVRAHFVCRAVALDAELGAIEPAGSVLADALEAVAIAVRAWVLQFGPGEAWRIASVLSGGLLLANTSSLSPPAPSD